MHHNIADGRIVSLPSNYTRVSSRDYLEIGRGDGLYVKRPTPYWFTVMKGVFGRSARWIAAEQCARGQQSIREPTRDERPPWIMFLMRRRYPDLAKETSDPWDVHFLAICRLHRQRLKRQFGKSIPDTGFVHCRESGEATRPAIYQQAIEGKGLWDMLDQQSGELLPSWQADGATIAHWLSGYIASDDVDCSPSNFVFSTKQDILYYIDSKPTFVRTRRTNDHNKRNIKEYILDKFL